MTLTLIWILALSLLAPVGAKKTAENLFDNYTMAAEGLPHLIQGTSLEEDYNAGARLEVLVTPRSEEGDIQETYGNVLCSCVRVKVEGHYGSGSIYRMLEDEIIVVTNRHVLQYWNEDSYVTFFNGRTAGGILLGLSEKADLGFICIPIEGFTYEELLAFRNIRLSQDVKEETAIFMIDMASKWNEPALIQGEVISPSLYLDDFQTQMIYAKGSVFGNAENNVVPGMSGGGVFDVYGNYLGMLTGATAQNEIAAVPAETIVMEYERMILK